MPTYSVITFGCQMNVHDSTRMEEVLVGAGYQPAEGPERADVVILNTCSIREKAEHKLRSEVGRLGLLKRERPELVIGVAGCVAQQEGEALIARLPQIDLVLGPDNISELPALLADQALGGPPRVRTVFDVDAPSFLQATPALGKTGVTAFVTVMKGCNERCSYCIVPHTRGPERYRSSREILDECRRLVDAGVREITLLGQTVNSYQDPLGALEPAPGAGSARWRHTRGSLASADETEFPALLYAIAREVPELLRLRYTSPHPRHLTPSLILAHRELAMLARHLHLPVQSGSDAQLRRMRRRYSAAEYVERTTALVEAVPGLTLSTDVIVGFSGETDEDFEATLALVRQVGFVALFGFKYSVRPYTPAQKLVDDVSEEEKARRLERLFQTVDEKKNAHLASLVGATLSVLVEGPGKTGGLTGRSERNEIVHLDGDLVTDPIHVGVGDVVRAKVTAAYKNSLAGRALEVTNAAVRRVPARTSVGAPAPGESKAARPSRALPVVG